MVGRQLSKSLPDAEKRSTKVNYAPRLHNMLEQLLCAYLLWYYWYGGHKPNGGFPHCYELKHNPYGKKRIQQKRFRVVR